MITYIFGPVHRVKVEAEESSDGTALIRVVVQKDAGGEETIIEDSHICGDGYEQELRRSFPDLERRVEEPTERLDCGCLKGVGSYACAVDRNGSSKDGPCDHDHHRLIHLLGRQS